MKHLLFILMLASGIVMWGQRTITGTVLDDLGEPLPGASVVEEGTTNGVLTGIDGDYSIKVSDDAKAIVVSYIGFENNRVALGASNVYNVNMSAGVELTDVVVTALGIKRDARSLGYAAQEVGGDEVSTMRTSNFVNQLSGKVAGLDIKSTSQMGGSSNVIVRGYSSLTGNNQALFVVDGVPISNSTGNASGQSSGRGGFDYGNAAMDINPEDIESISVLKGEAATALYGSRASNGVILITTKKGSKSKKGLGINFTSSATFGQIDKSTFIRYQNEYGPGYGQFYGGPDGYWEEEDVDGDGNIDYVPPYGEDASFGAKLDGREVYQWTALYPQLGSQYYLVKTPFLAAENDASAFYQTSSQFVNSISFSGGADATSFRLSFTNMNQSGIMENSSLNRNTINFAGTHEVGPKLDLFTSLTFTNNDAVGRYGTGYDNRNPNQSFRQWYQVTTDMKLQKEFYDMTGENISWNPFNSSNTNPHYFDNYYFNRHENYNNDTRNRLFGNAGFNYEINDWLSFMGRVGLDRYSELREERIAVGSVDVSSYSRTNRDFQEVNYDGIFSINKDLSSTLNLNANLGVNIRRDQSSSISSATNGGLIVPGVYSLANSFSTPNAPSELSWKRGVNGYFGRLSFGYDNFLYLDLTGRMDHSSTLPAENNKYFYPSASLSFVFSELMNSDVLSFGKLRFNYAQVGNDAPVLALVNTYDFRTPFGGNPMVSASGTSRNSNLVPERTTGIEVGTELFFWGRRLGLNASYYDRTTADQIIPTRVSSTTGSYNKFVNAGEIRNNGIELVLTGQPIQKEKFGWDIAVNWSKNNSEVLSLHDGAESLELASVQGGITINATVGQPYGTINGSNYVYHTDGSPIVYAHPFGGVRYRKTTSPEVIGDINPDWRGGVNNRFTYGNWGLSFLIDVQQGGDFFSLDTWYGYATGIYDITAGTNKDGNEVRLNPADGGGIFIDGAVMQTGVDADGKPISDGTANTTAFYASDVYSSLGYAVAPNAMHVYDASYVKLREAIITYSIPQFKVSSLNVQGVDLSLVGRNLWVIHKNSPYSDPEEGLSAGNIQGYQSGAYPAVREFGLRANFKF